MSKMISNAAKTAQNFAEQAHTYKETEMEALWRKKNGFHDFNLPDVRTAHAQDRRPSIVQDVLSYLGTKNPFPTQITAKDTVWLLDNTAYRNPKTNKFEAEFVACVFDQCTGVEVSTVVADLAEKLGLAKGDAQEATIRERLMPIMHNILPGRIVHMDFPKVAGGLKLGPGGRNAISSDIKQLPQFNGGDIVPSSARVPQGANGILRMKTFFAEPEGWSLISDIDDTIKITLTSSPLGILKSTFVDAPTAIKGMPEFYTLLSKLLTPSAPFFYLSASPYNLYPFLSQFLQSHFPQGTMILRDASWMNLVGLFENLTLGVQEYKTDRIEKIHSWVPKRKMLCIGDSTQSDPEAYAEMYKKYPGWIRLILIRKVTDIAAVGIEEKNGPERFEKAFKDVPKEAWRVFEEPQECEEIVRRVLGASK